MLHLALALCCLLATPLITCYAASWRKSWFSYSVCVYSPYLSTLCDKHPRGPVTPVAKTPVERLQKATCTSTRRVGAAPQRFSPLSGMASPLAAGQSLLASNATLGTATGPIICYTRSLSGHIYSSTNLVEPCLSDSSDFGILVGTPISVLTATSKERV